MAKIIFAMNQTLDGYVDHNKMSTSAVLFRHWTQQTRNSAGSIYGSEMYRSMRFWDNDHRTLDQMSLGDDPEWEALRTEFSAVWRNQPKWVVSQSLESVGPNATLVQGDLEGFVRHLKSQRHGDISVSGPTLAYSLGQLGLIDEYRLYLHPVAAGGGKPYFAGAQDKLSLVAMEMIDDGVVRLIYSPNK